MLLTEVAQLDVEVLLLVLEQRLGRLGDEDLPAVPGRPDPRSPMDGEAGVAPVGGHGLARVQAHANPDLNSLRPVVRHERALTLDRSEEGVARARERDEERVALRVDLVSAVSVERLAEQALMVGQHGAVVLAELLDEPRRALDVGEEERDRAGRGFHHGAKRDPSVGPLARAAGAGGQTPTSIGAARRAAPEQLAEERRQATGREADVAAASSSSSVHQRTSPTPSARSSSVENPGAISNGGVRTR